MNLILITKLREIQNGYMDFISDSFNFKKIRFEFGSYCENTNESMDPFIKESLEKVDWEFKNLKNTFKNHFNPIPIQKPENRDELFFSIFYQGISKIMKLFDY